MNWCGLRAHHVLDVEPINRAPFSTSGSPGHPLGERHTRIRRLLSTFSHRVGRLSAGCG